MTPAYAAPLSALTSQCITWTLGRRVVVLEWRGATWRMVARAA